MMKEAEFNGNGSEMEYSFFTVAKIVPFVVKKIRNTDIFLVKEFPSTRPYTYSTKAMSAKTDGKILFQKTQPTQRIIQIPSCLSIHI